MIKTTKHLCYILKIQPNELLDIIKNIDRFYYEKREIKREKDGTPKVKKGKIQERVLHPSTDRLKLIQQRVLKNILKNLPMPDYAYGAIPKKDNVMNAKKHQGKKYIFTTDLKDFFPSIRHSKVFEMYRLFDFSPTVARHLTQLTTYKGKLPQGTPTSPMLANLVFVKTGKRLIRFAQENGLTFTSFVDDLTFSAPIDFKSKAQEILSIITSDGFKLSHNKTNYKTKHPIVTGIVVKNNSIGVTDAFKIKMSVTNDKTEQQIRGLREYQKKVIKTNKRGT